MGTDEKRLGRIFKKIEFKTKSDFRRSDFVLYTVRAAAEFNSLNPGAGTRTVGSRRTSCSWPRGGGLLLEEGARRSTASSGLGCSGPSSVGIRRGVRAASP